MNAFEIFGNSKSILLCSYKSGYNFVDKVMIERENIIGFLPVLSGEKIFGRSGSSWAISWERA